MPAQEQARKLGPRSPTPTRSRSRPEPLPVCVLFPLPGLILLSPPSCVYLPRRLSHAAPRPQACPVSGQPSSAVQVCLGRSQGAGFIAISPPLPGSDPFGQTVPRISSRPILVPTASVLSLSAAHLCLETFLPNIVPLSHPAAVNG